MSTATTTTRALSASSQRIAPEKFAHVVLRTANFDAVIAWYAAVLQARVTFRNDFIAFLTYDDEHHRIAIARIPGIEDGPQMAAGTDHIAFTHGDLGDLLNTWARLKAEGIEPYWCLNHGPTTSMYYRDPDGNRIELQIDNFATAKEGQDWMTSQAFDKNPIGVEYNPDDLVRKFESGVPVAELVQRD